jgi:hypothetical protein
MAPWRATDDRIQVFLVADDALYSHLVLYLHYDDIDATEPM